MPIRMMAVVGARPQFIKAAMISKSLKSRGDIYQVLVHTGQHYDFGMSGVFFEELAIPKPDINLGIAGGTHAEMTGRMLIALEQAMVDTKPDIVLVFGDTNSTLAGALAAVKMGIPVVHAEAGARTHHLSNPEEVNRVCTDHVSSLLFAPLPCAMACLRIEGLEDRSLFTGDLMYDAYLYYSGVAHESAGGIRGLDGSASVIPDEYYYLTCHRQENTSETVLSEVLRAAEQLDYPVVYPVHPRVSKMVVDISGKAGLHNIIFAEPVGYLESLALLGGARAVVTDSGGLQREAFFARKKCVTLLPFPSADETLSGSRNTLVNPVTAESILSALLIPQEIDTSYMPFGDGHAATKMVDAIAEHFGD